MNKVIDSAFEKDQGKPPIWLLWILSTRGITSLRAICTSQARANAYRKGARLRDDVIRVWVEKTIADHLFGEGELEKNYPDARLASHMADELEKRQKRPKEIET